MIDNAALLSRTTVGSNLEVYWPSDQTYRRCVVVERDHPNRPICNLRYSDGTEERVDLTWEAFHLLDDGDDDDGHFGDVVGDVWVFWTPWMRGMGRGGRGLSTGPRFVEIGRVDTIMGTSLAGQGGHGPFLRYKCSSEAGQGARGEGGTGAKGKQKLPCLVY